MKQRKILLIYVALLAVVSAMTGCRRDTATRDVMNEAELLMESRPDSSLSLLSSLDARSIESDAERARYALLMSMALDKNYIDTTTFDVLQPAIDYYLAEGTPDEKLRTLYYQACIYRNRGDDTNAMSACIEALDLADTVTDTLTLARTLVGQAVLYYKQYRAVDFLRNQLHAAELFYSSGDEISALKCYAKALDGAVLSENKSLADSLSHVCTRLLNDFPEMEEFVNRYLLSYLIEFGEDDELEYFLKQMQDYDLSDDLILSLVEAYNVVGNTDIAHMLLGRANVSVNHADSLRYFIIKAEVCEKSGDIRGALDALKNQLYLSELVHSETFSNDLLFAEKKHQLVIDNLVEIQKKIG